MKIDDYNLFENYEDFIERLAEKLYLLEQPDVLEWRNDNKIATKKIQDLMKKARFLEGNQLDEDSIDLIFSNLRVYSHNRGLSNLLYKTNGLEEFNDKLRYLFQSEDIVKGFDSFIDLKGAGFQVTAQLLSGFDQNLYPLITEFMTNSLRLPDEIIERAEGIIRNFVKDTGYTIKHSRTSRYIKYLLIYKEIIRRLKLTSGNDLNILLWEIQPGVDTVKDSSIITQTDVLKKDTYYTNLAYENQLRDFLYEHPKMIEDGLELLGKEYQAGDAGIIDLFAKDKDGNYVVIELKRRTGGDSVIGQVLGYMGWVKKNKGEKVRGIIIIHEKSKRIDYAIDMLDEKVKVLYYRVSFQIVDNPEKFEY